MITFSQFGNYGRLGNQMFQYAMLRAASIKNGFEIILPNNNLDINIFKTIASLQRKEFPIMKVINVINKYNEPYFHYSDDVFEQPDGTDFAGYFQSYKYFQDVNDIVVEDFTLTSIERIYNKAISKIKNETASDGVISIHVRRGDYLKFPTTHPTCSIDYYNNCIEFFNNIGQFTYMVFSDDIAWCKKHFSKHNNVLYSKIENAPLAVVYMKCCSHNIIANSSFSWWGAYLNQNKNKIVCYPSIWFGTDGPQDIQDLIPPSWKKI